MARPVTGKSWAGRLCTVRCIAVQVEEQAEDKEERDGDADAAEEGRFSFLVELHRRMSV